MSERIISPQNDSQPTPHEQVIQDELTRAEVLGFGDSSEAEAARNTAQEMRSLQGYMEQRPRKGDVVHEIIEEEKENNPLEEGLFQGDVFYQAAKEASGDSPELPEVVWSVGATREVGGDTLYVVNKDHSNGLTEQLLITKAEVQELLDGKELIEPGAGRSEIGEAGYADTDPGKPEDNPESEPAPIVEGEDEPDSSEGDYKEPAPAPIHEADDAPDDSEGYIEPEPAPIVEGEDEPDSSEGDYKEPTPAPVHETSDEPDASAETPEDIEKRKKAEELADIRAIVRSAREMGGSITTDKARQMLESMRTRSDEELRAAEEAKEADESKKDTKKRSFKDRLRGIFSPAARREAEQKRVESIINHTYEAPESNKDKLKRKKDEAKVKLGALATKATTGFRSFWTRAPKAKKQPRKSNSSDGSE